jgi:AcrR family transcriptional regulator
MPRPRFDKLDPEVRARLLEAAAQEFSLSSYASASLNRIIEQAGISKGSLYYYFDDKEDLFRAVLSYLDECSEGLFTLAADDLTADNFWDRIEAFSHRATEVIRKHPWISGFLRMLHDVYTQKPTEGPLVEWCDRMNKQRESILRRGLALGVMRKDIPTELLQSVLNAVETTFHRWMFSHWDQMTADQRAELGVLMPDMFRRIAQVARPVAKK